MAEYVTEQKKTLLGFLNQNSESSFTIEELTEKIQKTNQGTTHTLGKSTVYRLMTKFVEEGKVKRFVRGQSKRFVYQIVSCERCHYHIHLRCMNCGKLFHLDEEFSEELMEKVKKICNFSVSRNDTVLLGTCNSCSKKNKV